MKTGEFSLSGTKSQPAEQRPSLSGRTEKSEGRGPDETSDRGKKVF
jgi:hypothetical protein